MTKDRATEIVEETTEGKIIDGSDINVRISVQRYQPEGRRYREIPGSVIKIRFSNARAVNSFARKLKEAVPSLL